MIFRSAPPLLLTLFLVASACAPASRPPAVVVPSAPDRAQVADRLFFGRNLPGGGSVSEEEWVSFLREVVTPRFPAGLTIWRAEGQWQDPRGGLEREAVMVVEIFHPGGAESEAAIAAIAEEYKRRFRQDAVLRITTSARMHFFE